MILNYIFILLSSFSFWGDVSQPFFYINQDIFDDFKTLLVEIRNQDISPENARLKFQKVVKKIRDEYNISGFDTTNVNLAFPLRNKNYRSVGGENGSGYRDKYFDLFDYSVNKSHPAHDIFIYDVNQDCIDDKDKQHIDVVSTTKGVVIATETNWQTDSQHRGGNYIWILDFKTGGLWYYAHQREVYVKVGQYVNSGDIIGQVGRTGFNAKAKRSDTHLHLMFLSITDQNLPKPYNYFNWIKTARTVFEKQYPAPILYKNELINKIKSLTAKPIKTNFQVQKPRI
jgi:peptidoglycan LD-endopeptidase LytH